MKISPKIISYLKNGKIGVLPTDTIYGLVGSALNKKTVERIYKVKKRNLNKPFIVLISEIGDLNLFKIKIKDFQKKIIEKYWPGPVSIIFECKNLKFSYLHRKTNSLAFRLPALKWLRTLLKETGPLVAPSANISNLPPVQTIKEAKKYFGKKVDFYVDAGKISKKPSMLIDIRKRKIKILRK